MYKLVKINNMLCSSKYVIQCDISIILEFETYDEDYLLEILKNLDDDRYFVCEYDNKNNYIETVADIYKYDNDYHIDSVEYNNRVMLSIAHNPISEMKQWDIIIDDLKRYFTKKELCEYIINKIV